MLKRGLVKRRWFVVLEAAAIVQKCVVVKVPFFVFFLSFLLRSLC